MLESIQKKIESNAIFYLLSYAILIRIAMLLLYADYSIFPDSGGYIELANDLSDFNLTGYSGKRTPGYPSIIALVGNNLNWVKVIQHIFGIISTLLLFDLVKRETQSKFTAFLAAFFATSFIHLIFFEAAILTETTALFVLLVVVWFIRVKSCLNVRTSILNIIAISILFAYLYLVKPMFIYAPIFFALFFLMKNFQENYKKALFKSSLVLLIPLFTFYSWSSLNEKNIGVFGSTYFLGFNLAQTATPFFELVPEENQTIRDIFVKHRDSIASQTSKSITMSIWAAHDELVYATHLKPPQLSKKLGDISIDLFKQHPDLYLKQVSISWLDFWTESILWKPKQIKSVAIKNILMGTWLYIQQWIALVINIMFLYFSIKHLKRIFKFRIKSFDFNLFLVSIVLLGSVAQAMITYGSNSRFSFPYFSLIIYFVFINLFTLKTKNAAHT